MDGPNFDPVEGEEVRIEGNPGVFRIAQVHSPAHSFPGFPPSGLDGMVTLEPIGISAIRQKRLDGISWTSLRYVDETRPVRRTIEWLKNSPDNRQYPGYIVDYEVKAGEDHVGRPSIFVRFFIDPDYLYVNGQASEEKVIALNEFLDGVRDELLNLELDRWISVRVGEERRTLDVAS
jgi:hypothetical protein